MPEFSCSVSNNSARWSVVDFLTWRYLPERLGGGKAYIQRFKDTWVAHNRMHIRAASNGFKFPPELLAGVCWIEAGGDPTIIDIVAFEVRSFDWSGPDWVDHHLTISKAPTQTSFGAASMQLRTAAQTLGLDQAAMDSGQWRALANCLENDIFNIQTVARHLRQLIDLDGLQTSPPDLDLDAVRVVGARYNRGMGLSLEKIRQNTSYGNFIVKFWPRFSALLR